MDMRDRKRARLARQAYDEPPMNIPPTLQAFKSGGFINPLTISAVSRDLQDLHISVITKDSAPPSIRRMSEDEALENYIITPLIFPEM